jgi:predicted Fe-Mo cluster-binding NifX family protein
MKVAVASMGTVPEAWVGIRFGMCSQFLVFDLGPADSADRSGRQHPMEYVVVSVPPRPESPERVSLAAIRAVAKQNVSAVITGDIKDICRQTLLNLGIEVIDGVQGMTVQEAIEHYKATGLQTPESRRGVLTRVAVASHGEGLEAPLEIRFGVCSSFVVVEPTTMEWEVIRVEPDGPAQKVNRNAIRAVAQSGATVLITPEIHPECCMVLRALAVTVYLAPEGITVREAIERYEQGELDESLITPFDNL